MPEQFQLRNSGFSSSLTCSLSSLLATSSLCDCILICSDGQLSAHKVVLAAASSFFSSVFSLHQHNFPLIYLRGMKSGQMQAVLDYVYSGVTQVAEEDLASFLAVAEDLKINGLNKCEEPVTEEKTVTDPQKVTLMSKEFQEKIQSTAMEENEEISVKTHLSANIAILETSSTDEYEQVESSEISFIPGPGTQERIIHDVTEKSRTIRKRKTKTGNAEDQNIYNPPKLNSKRSTPMKSDNVILLAQTSKTNPIVCPVCSIGVPSSFYLQAHMTMKCETQCKDCKLFFTNCQSLAFHKKGRCRLTEQQALY